jgi:hypothetical protein
MSSLLVESNNKTSADPVSEKKTAKDVPSPKKVFSVFQVGWFLLFD